MARPNDVETVKQLTDVGPEGFEYAVETTDGSAQFAKGDLNYAGTEHEAISVKGAYTWIDEKTGEKFTVEYLADENGFQPTGDLLPVA